MTRALARLDVCTKKILKSAATDTSISAPGLSMKLPFVHYIRASHGTNVKKTVRTDGFPGSLHALLLMADTVVLVSIVD